MYFRCWNPFCVWRRVNSDEKCEVPSSQPSMDSAVEQPKGGIPEDCPVNMARRVTQLPHIDRVTYAQPRVRMQASRTNKKKRPSPQIFFTPPTLSTTPSNAGSGVIVRGPVLPMLTVISGVFFMLLRHTWHTVHWLRVLSFSWPPSQVKQLFLSDRRFKYNLAEPESRPQQNLPTYVCFEKQEKLINESVTYGLIAE